MTATRRAVLAGGMAAALLGAAPAPHLARPRAIAMWDFSWLERRWPGGGYEDWNVALDGLAERGYDAVRIDAFPHLMLSGPETDRTLKKWGDQPWGAPGRVVVRIMPALTTFIAAAKQRGIKVALSSWYREDAANVRMRLADPKRMAAAWIATIAAIERAGLLDAILYVDLCNEWPASLWAPFLSPQQDWGAWPTPVAQRYVAVALDGVRAAYPALPLCFSSERGDVDAYAREDIRRLDLIEHHIWMVDQEGKAFAKALAAATDATEWSDKLGAVGARVYRAQKARWDGLLTRKIDALAAVSRRTGKPLVTTEGWAVVGAQDWPMLDWGWIKESCGVGVTAATASGRYLSICTSNFCGPQNISMWRDVAWHRRQTDTIKAAVIDRDLHASRLYARLA